MKFFSLDYFIFRNIRRAKGKVVKARQRGTLSNWNVFRVFACTFVFFSVVTFKPANVARSSFSVDVPESISSPKNSTTAEIVLGAVNSSNEEPATPPPHPIPSSMLKPVPTARAVLVKDTASGEILFEKDIKVPYAPASLTKLMTALLTLENRDMEEIVEVPDYCIDLLGNQMDLYWQEQITVGDLLKGLLINSASDAACTLANHTQPEEEFVKQMNIRASELGMHHTWLSNPIGLDEEINSQHSTAQNLMNLVEELAKSSVFRDIVSTKEEQVHSADNAFVHYLINTNDLLSSFSGTTGMKTGTTARAGECLAFSFERDGHELFAIMLGSEDRFVEMEEIVEWVFGSYKWD